jgi:hypothetical protein
VNPLIEPLRSLYAETSSPWQKPTAIATDHLEEYLSGYHPPTTIPWQASSSFPHRNLATVEHFSSRILFTAGIHFPPVLRHNQGYPKVCSDPLNLPNTGHPLCWNIVVFNLFSIFPDQGLNCFDLESSRVFFVKFPEPSLFQISELLHFIKIRKKFIKMQNQFCLNPSVKIYKFYVVILSGKSLICGLG